VVPNARVVPRLNVREAAELAHYGAKVLHPRALAPLGPRACVHVRPFARPDDAGTEITARRVAGRSPVRAVVATMDQAVVRVVGRGLLALPGVAARAFGALYAAGLPVALVSQAVTEYAIAFTLGNGQVAAALDALRATFAPELARGEVETIDAELGAATIGVVGLGAAHEPRVAARVYAALADAGIGVLASAHGATGASLSVVVDATRAVEAQRAIHDAFQLHQAGGGRAAPEAHADVVLLGVGTIGRELVAQLAESGDGSPLRVCALIDRSGYVFDPAGLSRRRLAELRAHKAAGKPLALDDGARAASAEEAIRAIGAHALSRPVLVDATASDTTAVLELALGLGWDVALANKVPLAADHASVRRLHEAAHARGRRLLHEATVGAGLPVIDTLRKLLEAGDRVLRIEGCPSGTLGFLFGELGRGVPFSAALRDAMARGYTEPDPRDDLSGTDVARKALILARLLGFRGNLDDVAVESLVPPTLRDVPLDEFLARLGELDAPWAARVRAARAKGRVLRYRIRVTGRSIAVGLVAVAPTDPLGALSGTDNQFAFTTTRYRAQPLVITGPGAGAAVTATGVYGDLLRLAAERSS
jgi:aspartokinase/homoserine dehydrogenase 1